MFANLKKEKDEGNKRESGKVRVVSSALEQRVEALEKTLVNVTKFALQNEQAIRQIKSAIDPNWLTEEDSLIFKSAKAGIASVQEFKKVLLEQRKNNVVIKDALGSPHIDALLQIFKAFSEDKTLGNETERQTMRDNLEK